MVSTTVCPPTFSQGSNLTLSWGLSRWKTAWSWSGAPMRKVLDGWHKLCKFNKFQLIDWATTWLASMYEWMQEWSRSKEDGGDTYARCCSHSQKCQRRHNVPVSGTNPGIASVDRTSLVTSGNSTCSPCRVSDDWWRNCATSSSATAASPLQTTKKHMDGGKAIAI